MTRHGVHARGLAAVGLVLGLVAAAPAPGAESVAPDGMVRIPGGGYVSFYRALPEADTGDARPAQPAPVAPFWMDALPVTNRDFLAFVESHPRWRRSQVPRLLAEEAYLSHWAGDLDLGAADPAAPVTFVSWFAAAAYCEHLDKRLPTEAEWELAAAPPDEPAAARAETRERILAFYARPRAQRPQLPRAGSTPPNAFGVRDLHGVQWEWIEDWNATLPSAEGRGSGDRATGLFCGGAAALARDAADYPTFMRFAFRSSLEGRHTLHHLGFRCVRSAS